MKNRQVFQSKSYTQVSIFLRTVFLWPAFHRAHSHQVLQQRQGKSSPPPKTKKIQLRFQQPSQARGGLASEDVYGHAGSITVSDQRPQTAAQLQAAANADMKQRSVNQG